MSTNLIEEAQKKSAKSETKSETTNGTSTQDSSVSQNAVDADVNKRDKIVLNSVKESLIKIAEELRTAAAKLAGNVDQTTLDRLNVVGQQLDSIK
jgi:hypothetical protein